MALGETLGHMAGSLLGGPPQKLAVDVSGLDEALCAPVAVAVVKGLLTPVLGEDVNYVNAEQNAKSRGIEVVRSIRSAPGEYPNLVEVALSGGDRGVKLAGTVFGDHELRLVRFDDYRLELRPEGNLLVLENHDKPGVVGKIGTLLAEADVNIADIHLARRGQEAVAVLRLDQEPSEELVERLSRLPEVKSARRVLLG
jgi:D-3-phosphoglycerate dehydrogenase